MSETVLTEIHERALRMESPWSEVVDIDGTDVGPILWYLIEEAGVNDPTICDWAICCRWTVT